VSSDRRFDNEPFFRVLISLPLIWSDIFTIDYNLSVLSRPTSLLCFPPFRLNCGEKEYVEGFNTWLGIISSFLQEVSLDVHRLTGSKGSFSLLHSPPPLFHREFRLNPGTTILGSRRWMSPLLLDLRFALFSHLLSSALNNLFPKPPLFSLLLLPHFTSRNSCQFRSFSSSFSPNTPLRSVRTVSLSLNYFPPPFLQF